MKKILILIIVFTLSSYPVFADSSEDFEESGNIVEVDMGSELPLYIRAGVGFKLESLNLKLDKLNNTLESSGFDFRPLPEVMVLYGIEGSGGVRKGNIYGAYFLHGKNESTGINGEKARFSISYGGLSYERGIYMKENTDISIGSGLGIGFSRLDLLHYKKDTIQESFIDATGTTLEKNFLVIEPRINLYQQLTTTIGLDFSLGYFISYDLDDSWSLSGYELDDSLDDLRGGNVSLRFTFGM